MVSKLEKKSVWLGVWRIIRPPWHFTAYCHQSSGGHVQMGQQLRWLYSVKANYQLMSSNKALIDQWPWKLVWQEKMPPKISDFGWLALRNAFWVLTQANLKRRKFHPSNRCYMCINNRESFNHIFLHCRVASDIWSIIYVPILPWLTVGLCPLVSERFFIFVNWN